MNNKHFPEPFLSCCRKSDERSCGTIKPYIFFPAQAFMEKKAFMPAHIYACHIIIIYHHLCSTFKGSKVLLMHFEGFSSTFHALSSYNLNPLKWQRNLTPICTGLGLDYMSLCPALCATCVQSSPFCLPNTRAAGSASSEFPGNGNQQRTLGRG